MNPLKNYINSIGNGNLSFNSLVGAPNRSSFNSLVGVKKKNPIDISSVPGYANPQSVSSTNTIAANPAATPATPPIPPQKNPTLKTPAAQTYMSNLSQPVPTYGSSVTDSQGRAGTAKFDPNTGKPLTNPSDSASTANISTSDTNPQSAYIKYLTGMFDPANVESARKSKEDSAKRLADIQNQSEKASYDARKQYERFQNEIGVSKSFAQGAASESDRRNSSVLADNALRESAAARTASVYKDTYDSYINAGKSVYEAEQAAEKAKTDATQQIFTNDLATKKFEEDKRQYGLDYALKSQELDLKKQEISQKNTDNANTVSTKEADASNSLNLINTLLENPKLGSISGAIQGGLGLGTLDPRSDVQLARNQFNQLKGMLSLENRSKLKGQGAVSDFEGKTLDSAASSLGRNLGDAEFAKQLKQVKGAIATSHGLTADVLLIDPTTKQSQIVSSDSSKIAEAIRDGLIVEYQ